MRFLCIGDCHFKPSVLHDAEILIKSVSAKIKKWNPDFVVLLGDLFDDHERMNTYVNEYVYQLIHKLSKHKPVYILVGNHDFSNNDQYMSTHHSLLSYNKWKNVTVVDNAQDVEIQGIQFSFIPFIPESRSFLEALETCQWRKSLCVFAHQEFQGCQMPYGPSQCKEVWDLDHPLIISGHIHNKHIPQPNLIYVGSCFQTNFKDSTDKTIGLFFVSEDAQAPLISCPDLLKKQKTIQYKKLKLKAQKKILIQCELSALETKLGEIQRGKDDKIRIEITDTDEQIKAFKKGKKYKELQADPCVKLIFHIPAPEIVLPDLHKFHVSYKDLLREIVYKESEEVKKIYEEIFS